MEQYLRIREPFGFVPESRQRRAAQVVERAATGAAAKALQVVGESVPIAAFVATTGAAARWRSGLRDQCNYLVEASCGMQGVEHLPALWLIQRWQPGKPVLETGRFHDRLLTLGTGVGPWDR